MNYNEELLHLLEQQELMVDKKQVYLDEYSIDMDIAYKAYINEHAHGRSTKWARSLAERMPEVCYQQLTARMDNYARINRLRG
jgi:hypothetical protein|tara:strand:+ start:313 stop:561 length:249 start_codon:yes stop_codon:yes gene_type:complete